MQEIVTLLQFRRFEGFAGALGLSGVANNLVVKFHDAGVKKWQLPE